MDNWKENSWFQAGGLLFALALLSAFLWWAPFKMVLAFERQDAADFASLVDQNRKTLAQCLGGLAVLVGLIFTARTVRLTEQGKFTDRFAAAISHLASTNEDGSRRVEIRLGGIYALAKIAKDSPTDAGSVGNILAAYVRTNAELTSLAGGEDQDHPSDPVSIDVEAAIQVLASMNAYAKLRSLRMTLEHINANGLELQKTNISGFRFAQSSLESAIFRSTIVEQADFGGCRLRESDFVQSKIGHAKKETNFRSADLTLVDFSRSEIRNTSFAGACCERVDFRGCNLHDVSFKDANLFGAKFRGARLHTVDFHGSELTDVEFDDCNLQTCTGLTDQQLATVKIKPRNGPNGLVPR